MRSKRYEMLAAMVAEAAVHGANAAGLEGFAAETCARDAVHHFAWLLENSADDTFGGRRFNPYVFAGAAGYPIDYPCTGTVDGPTQQAATRYAAGASLDEVAVELGEPVAAARARLVAAGVEIRKY